MMRFIIQRDKLMASIQDVMKAISSRAAIPILTGIKIDVNHHGITLTGSDSDISIESYTPAEENGIVYLEEVEEGSIDRKSTRLNSSHVAISYAVFCLKKKKNS